MVKKARIIGGALVVPVILSVLFGVVYLVLAQEGDLETLPKSTPIVDLSALLGQADQYVTAGEYEQAEILYRGIMADHPNTGQAIHSRRALVKLIAKYVHIGEFAKVDELALNLEASLVPGEELAKILMQIGMSFSNRAHWLNHCANWGCKDQTEFGYDREYAIAHQHESADAQVKALNYFQKAEQMYQTHAPSWTTEHRAIESRRGIIDMLWALGRVQDATFAEDELMANYPCGQGNTSLAKVLVELADRHRTAGQHGRATQLYQHAIKQCPGNEHEMDLLAGLAQSSIARADYKTAQVAVAQLLDDHSSRHNFVRRMNEIAKDYREAEQNDEAEAICRHIVTHVAADKQAVYSQGALVIMKLKSGGKEASARELVILLGQFPDDRRKLEVLQEVGRAYEQAKEYVIASDLYRLATELAWELGSDKIESNAAAAHNRAIFEYLKFRAQTTTTEEEAGNVFSAFRENILRMLDHAHYPRDSMPVAVEVYREFLKNRAFDSFITRRDEMTPSVQTAYCMMDVLGSNASEHQRALAKHVLAWTYSWSGQRETAIQLMLDVAAEFNHTVNPEVEYICADSLAHAYIYTYRHLNDPVAAERYLNMVRERWPDGRFTHSMIMRFQNMVNRRNNQNL